MKKGIVAFAFGSPQKIASNKLIAQIAMEQSILHSAAPIYTQINVLINKKMDVKYIDEYIGGHLPSTIGIAYGAVEWAKKHSINELIVVAAQPHMWRCIRDLEKIVNGKIIITACDAVYLYDVQSWFCADSTQKYTKTQKVYQRRDFFLKVVPFCVYKYIMR